MNSVTQELLRSAQTYERAFVRACLSSSTDGGADSPEAPPSAWLTYRRIVRIRLRETIEHAFERVHARLGPSKFAELEAAFFHARGPRTVLLREVPREFLEFLSARIDAGEITDLPPWTLDLARFEWAELEVAYARDDDGGDVEPLAMNRALAISGACRVLRLGHRVHELSRDEPFGSPRAQSVSVCLYRDSQTFDVRVLELSESAVALLDGPSEGASLAERVQAAAAATGATLDAVWIEAFASLLTDLTERGIVLGSRSQLSKET